jgi:hypothetical protein
MPEIPEHVCPVCDYDLDGHSVEGTYEDYDMIDVVVGGGVARLWFGFVCPGCDEELNYVADVGPNEAVIDSDVEQGIV